MNDQQYLLTCIVYYTDNPPYVRRVLTTYHFLILLLLLCPIFSCVSPTLDVTKKPLVIFILCHFPLLLYFMCVSTCNIIVVIGVGIDWRYWYQVSIDRSCCWVFWSYCNKKWSLKKPENHIFSNHLIKLFCDMIHEFLYCSEFIPCDTI